MTEPGDEGEPETVHELYRRTLLELADEHGEDYARDTAAFTIATLLTMVSRGHARLPAYPLFLAPPTDDTSTSVPGSLQDRPPLTSED